MDAYLWLAIVLVGLGLLGAGAAMYLAPMIWRRRSLAGLGDVPPTPLQKRAWWALAFGVVWCGALVVITTRTDPSAMMENRSERLLFTAVLVGGLLVYVMGLALLKRGNRGGTVVLDERDRTILARVGGIQSGFMLASLAVWAIALTEVYWDEGSIPVAYANLIFWSTFVVYFVSHSLGILLGYALGGDDAQG